jgi:hypothetical protein
MPGRDGTGPLGKGPMTGRGMGYCAGFSGFGRLAGGRMFRAGGLCLLAGLVSLGTLLVLKNKND